MGNIPGHRLGNDLATNELTTRDLNNANDNLPATSPKSDAGKFRLRHALLM
ncbi:MAG: hypothetical protein KGM99_14060 [Burkholderiales bacterium]|nr:hypothetical protein [Burkholderiales bacterium]